MSEWDICFHMRCVQKVKLHVFVENIVTLLSRAQRVKCNGIKTSINHGIEGQNCLQDHLAVADGNSLDYCQ